MRYIAPGSRRDRFLVHPGTGAFPPALSPQFPDVPSAPVQVLPSTVEPCGPAPEGGLYGVFDAGPFLVAVSIDMVREVVPRPDKFVAWPSRVNEVVGAMELRGTMIPVIDFSPLLGAPSDNRCTVVMVVRVGKRLCGLLIDHISGVEQIDADQFTAAETVPNCKLRPQLVIAGFFARNRSGIVLNCEALATFEGMPLSLERNPQGLGKAEAGEPTLLFSAGAHRFGLAAQVIDASIPRTTFDPAGIDDPVWVGMLTYKGALIPVVDTLALLGLGHAERPGEGSCVVVRLATNRLIALRIDRVHDMQRVVDSARLTLQDFRIGRSGLLRSLLECDATYLLIDPERLLADPLLMEIGAIGEDVNYSGRDPKLAAHAAYLVMNYGAGRLAVPMQQVEEIIPGGGGDRIGLIERAEGIVGLIAHRGRGVPLYNLSGHIGIAADEGTGAFVVIASAEGRQMGFAINGLCSVERVPLQKLQGNTDPAMQCGPLAETICGADGQTTCVVDLEALVRRAAAC